VDGVLEGHDEERCGGGVDGYEWVRGQRTRSLVQRLGWKSCAGSECESDHESDHEGEHESEHENEHEQEKLPAMWERSSRSLEVHAMWERRWRCSGGDTTREGEGVGCARGTGGLEASAPTWDRRAWF
jgi:hypothetical protein